MRIRKEEAENDHYLARYVRSCLIYKWGASLIISEELVDQADVCDLLCPLWVLILLGLTVGSVSPSPRQVTYSCNKVCKLDEIFTELGILSESGEYGLRTLASCEDDFLLKLVKRVNSAFNPQIFVTRQVVPCLERGEIIIQKECKLSANRLCLWVGLLVEERIDLPQNFMHFWFLVCISDQLMLDLS